LPPCNDLGHPARSDVFLEADHAFVARPPRMLLSVSGRAEDGGDRPRAEDGRSDLGAAARTS
jgi:hypothetical protein